MKNTNPLMKTRFKIGECYTFEDYPISITLIGFKVVEEDNEIFPQFELMILNLLSPGQTKMVWVDMEWFAKLDLLIKFNKAKILY